MIRRFAVVCAVFSLFVVGCSSARVGYQNDVAIRATSVAREYDVRFKLMKLVEDEDPEELASTGLSLKAGQPGETSLGTKENQMKWTALVDETPKVLSVKTTVVIKKGGDEIWSSTQNISLPRPRPRTTARPAPRPVPRPSK